MVQAIISLNHFIINSIFTLLFSCIVPLSYTISKIVTTLSERNLVRIIPLLLGRYRKRRILLKTAIIQTYIIRC
jgi:hypothetical protein